MNGATNEHINFVWIYHDLAGGRIDMSKCLKWGSSTITKCVKWIDQGSDQCVQWADHGATECTQWADQGSNQCSGFWKWFCKAYYWVANWVCVASAWVAKIVCIVTAWIAKLVCVLTTVIVTLICLLYEYIVIPIVKATLFGLLAPFGAAIDSVCETCHAYDWVKDHFWQPGRIEYVSTQEVPGRPGIFQYDFLCHCVLKGKDEPVSVIAANDDEAAELAKKACIDACS